MRPRRDAGCSPKSPKGWDTALPPLSRSSTSSWDVAFSISPFFFRQGNAGNAGSAAYVAANRSPHVFGLSFFFWSAPASSSMRESTESRRLRPPPFIIRLKPLISKLFTVAIAITA